MKFNIKKRERREVEIGSVLIKGGNRYLVTNSDDIEYPIMTIDLTKNIIENMYKSLDSIDRQFDDYEVYSPDEITLEVQE